MPGHAISDGRFATVLREHARTQGWILILHMRRAWGTEPLHRRPSGRDCASYITLHVIHRTKHVRNSKGTAIYMRTHYQSLPRHDSVFFITLLFTTAVVRTLTLLVLCSVFQVALSKHACTYVFHLRAGNGVLPRRLGLPIPSTHPLLLVIGGWAQCHTFWLPISPPILPPNLATSRQASSTSEAECHKAVPCSSYYQVTLVPN